MAHYEENLVDEWDAGEAEGQSEAYDEMDELDEVDELDEGDDMDELDELDEGDEMDALDEGDEGDSWDEYDEADESGEESSMDEALAFALAAEDSDEFFRRLARVARRVVRTAATVARRAAPIVGRVARAAAPILRVIPHPAAQIAGRVAGRLGRAPDGRRFRRGRPGGHVRTCRTQSGCGANRGGRGSTRTYAPSGGNCTRGSTRSCRSPGSPGCTNAGQHPRTRSHSSVAACCSQRPPDRRGTPYAGPATPASCPQHGTARCRKSRHAAPFGTTSRAGPRHRGTGYAWCRWWRTWRAPLQLRRRRPAWPHLCCPRSCPHHKALISTCAGGPHRRSPPRFFLQSQHFGSPP